MTNLLGLDPKDSLKSKDSCEYYAFEKRIFIKHDILENCHLVEITTNYELAKSVDRYQYIDNTRWKSPWLGSTETKNSEDLRVYAPEFWLIGFKVWTGLFWEASTLTLVAMLFCTKVGKSKLNLLARGPREEEEVSQCLCSALHHMRT